jgi:hypothetical protein
VAQREQVFTEDEGDLNQGSKRSSLNFVTVQREPRDGSGASQRSGWTCVSTGITSSNIKNIEVFQTYRR